jgi:hypothetical protein
MASATTPEALKLRQAFLDALAQDGVLMVPYSHGQIRAVTHYGIDRADIDRTVVTVGRALAEVGAASAQVLTAAGGQRPR